jgi:hypothetical protein
MYGSHPQLDYELGTRQPLGVRVYGQRTMPMITGLGSSVINRQHVLSFYEMSTRTSRGRSDGSDAVLEYAGPRQLNILVDDMVFECRHDLPPNVMPDGPPGIFVSFNGLPKYKTAVEYRLRYRFRGLALLQYEFDNACQGQGMSFQTTGTGNFINKSGETLMPGDQLTWEPDLNEFSVSARRKYGVAGESTVHGRFVKYKPTLLEKSDWFDCYPNTRDALKAIKDKDPKKMSDAERTLFWGALYGLIIPGDVIGVNQETTPPNQYGRVKLP